MFPAASTTIKGGEKPRFKAVTVTGGENVAPLSTDWLQRIDRGTACVVQHKNKVPEESMAREVSPGLVEICTGWEKDDPPSVERMVEITLALKSYQTT